MFDQNKYSKSDIHFLQKTFGNQNVFDFSGINSYTNNIGNYYEPGHFRDIVGKQILDSIYQ
jgi:hypothetical protein